MRELESVSHREYCTGYYQDSPLDNAQISSSVDYLREKAYFATANSLGEYSIPEHLESENENGRLYMFTQKNKVSVGDSAEIISPHKCGRAFTVKEIYSESGEAVDCAPHPSMKFFIRVPFEVSGGDIMRSGN